jgi:ATP-dependent helicase/nuclease subunit A
LHHGLLEVSGAGAFGDSGEVHVLITLLRALSDPQDALSLIAVLRGPLFGISDQELFAFKQGGGWFSLFQEQGDVSAKRPPSATAAALGALHRYYRWTRVLPSAAALDRILEDTGYLALSATTPGGVAAGDVLHAIDRVRQVMEQGGSLADAAAALETDSETNNEVESLPLEPGRTDVVRLMNLHKAKGLEAEVVFLADPAGGVKTRVDVHIERAGTEAVGWLKIVRRNEGSYGEKLLGEHPDWPAWEAAEKPYLEAEEDRLLYVAATRARQMLVISRSVHKLRSPAWGALNDFLAAAVELPVPLAVSSSPVSPLESGKALLFDVVEQQREAQLRARTGSWEVKAATAEARHIARIVRSAAVAEDDPSKVVSSDTPSHRADAGQAWGTLIHGLLEHAMRQKDFAPEDLQRLGMWLTVDEPQLRSVLDQAVATVLEVAKAPFWEEAKRSERSVETPFAFADDANTIVMGVIDLLFGRGGSWRIIDYKTGAGSAELALAYQEQLKIYEQALAKVGLQHISSNIQPL